MLRNTNLDTPKVGLTYWVIRYTNGLENPLCIEDFVEATYVGKYDDQHWWSQPYYMSKFASNHYMEIPKL